ncbi:MAG TPA: response regulator transcription factor [Nocardioidaceae bacterium]|nr:response regulator transcription factor [Nocardioidaceae bacterium]
MVPNVRVLIVDDQALFRRAAAAVVDAMDGFVLVGEAVDGEASLAATRESRPDLVLMDVNLPVRDGMEATRRIRALDDAPVVVLLSTYELSDLGDDPLRCGAVAYVPKSDFDAGRLHAIWDAARR